MSLAIWTFRHSGLFNVNAEEEKNGIKKLISYNDKENDTLFDKVLNPRGGTKIRGTAGGNS